jgi:hypothetical protein
MPSNILPSTTSNTKTLAWMLSPLLHWTVRLWAVI